MNADLSTAPPSAASAMEPPAGAPSRRWIVRALLPGLIVLAFVATMVVVARVAHDHDLTPPDAHAIGLPVLIGRTLHEPDGRTIAITLDPAIRIKRVYETPVGILLDTRDERDAITGPTTDVLYLQSAAGVTDQIAANYDSPVTLTSDGRIVVMVESDGYAHAIDLVTHTDIKTRFAPGTDVEQPGRTMVTNVGGGWALLADNAQSIPNQPAELWNLRTGAITEFRSAPNTAAFAVGPNGSVLLGAYASAQIRYGEPGAACFDYEPADAGTTGPTWSTGTGTGYCATVDFEPSALSPTGAWAVTIIDGQSDLLGTADLHAGWWNPIGISRLDTPPMFWDSPSSFIDSYTSDADGSDRYQRCFTDGHCQDLGSATGAIIGQPLT
jgi:hypothetical protein